MKTKEVFQLFKEHQDKSLLFEYKPNEYVKANYHITEVKHLKIDSVDCGAGTDAWNETIIQLWESPTSPEASGGKRDFLTVYKALSILNNVGKIKAYDMEAEAKFEYSNKTFHTAQMFVNDYEIRDNNLIIKLGVEKTDCKAKTVCGVVEEVKAALVSNEPCCSPEGNCC